ncbi:MAG: M56 family metallopeptidase, partial [Flavobacteriaceae bacterium]|nr:M56 family metallopeptidase [Flavobacteriaceae bacterium]
MIEYLVKSSACLAIFLLFYKLNLERQSFHHYKRFYLLSAILISLSVPFITLIEYVEIAPSYTPTMESSPQLIDTGFVPLEKSFGDYLPSILWSLYIVGAGIFLLRFVLNLYHLVRNITDNPQVKDSAFTNVLIQNLVNPHSFFHFIFLNKRKYYRHEIPQEVLLHEQAHAKQKHALDILFIEILQILFWFNPLIYLIKKDIKLNHEFLADQAVINQGVQPQAYQKLLLSYSSSQPHFQLGNAINYSSIKKRFTIMKTQTSKTTALISAMLIIPLFTAVIFGFSEKKIKYVETSSSTEHEATLNSANSEKESESFDLISQDPATREEIQEYNQLAKKYNEMDRSNMHIIGLEVDRLKYLYNKMSENQRNNAEPFPDLPEPPPAPAPPKPLVPAKTLKPGLAKTELPAPPPVPASPIGVKGSKDFPSPPPPPKPQDPVDYIKEMAEK